MNNKTDKALKISRVFDAPQVLVWKAFSEKEHVQHWWGPKGIPLDILQFEFKDGGVFHYKMNMPNVPENYGVLLFKSIQEPHTIIYKSAFADANGKPVRAFFSDLFPILIRSVLTFEEENGKTTVTMTGMPVEATKEEIEFFQGMIENMQNGFAGTFDQLEVHLTKLSGGA
jgi:uncharacterized protein YndB with AHSA1/START domain